MCHLIWMSKVARADKPEERRTVDVLRSEVPPYVSGAGMMLLNDEAARQAAT